MKRHVVAVATISLLVLSLGSSGCDSSNGPQLGSQTNWLIACESSDDCGDLICSCGACTEPCASDADCDGLAGTSCVGELEPGSVALCGGQAADNAMCLPRCEDAPCAKGTNCVAGVCVPHHDSNAELTLDLGSRFQTLVGFGAGIAFSEDQLAGHARADDVYDLLFNETGLDSLRVRNRFNGDNEAELQALRQIVDGATSPLGRTPILFIGEGSPRPELKANGDRMCAGNFDTCTLAQAPSGGFDYEGLAAYWQESLEAYDRAGVQFDYLGIQNHPNLVPPEGGGGEACRFLPEEGSATVTVNGGDVDVLFPGYAEALAAVEARLSGVANAPRLIAPEVTGLGSVNEYLDPLDLSAVGALSIHLYGVDPLVDLPALQQVQARASALQLPVLQTEVQAGPLETALLLHYALTAGGASAFLQNDLISTETTDDADALVRLTEDSFEPLLLQDVFAHYARDTDPGWIRVEAESDNDGLLVSAWLAPDEGSLTLIFVNASADELRPQVNVPSTFVGSLFQSTVTRTVFEGLERSASLGQLPEDGRLRLPPGSMVSVVFAARTL